MAVTTTYGYTVEKYNMENGFSLRLHQACPISGDA
jgi:hypothetical protein